MALAPAKLYKAHVLNLRAVHSGIRHTERQLRAAISRQDDATTETLLKILLLLVGAWAECRFRKLLYEPAGFNASERSAILATGSQLNRWLSALELGYRKRYKVARALLSDRTLRITAWMRYRAVRDLINFELKPVIEMRNTLAHGQWDRPLNSEEDDISSTMMSTLRVENALSARFKLSLLEAMAALIHDLVSTEKAFERDYDAHFDKIVFVKRDLQSKNYEAWQRSMVEKYKRGQRKRIQVTQPEETSR